MNQGFSIKNIFINLTKGQKIAFLAGSVLIIVLVVVLAVLVEKPDFSDTVEDTEPGINMEEDITDDTKKDGYGNITTVDPELITTYFPHQVMREHSEDRWIAETLRYFLFLDKDTKTINALIEYCDEENDKKLVQEYIKSIPIDLSNYKLEFETFTEDAICEY